MKSLTLISQGKNTSVALQTQLNQILGDKVKINALYLDGKIEENITDELIVITSQAPYQASLRYINPACPILVARRSINYHNIDKLLSLSPDTNVLLVNESAATALETIQLLKALGIDHLNYYPFAPDISIYPHLKIAITPGELQLIPDFVEQVIDIKTRNIDVTTLVEILKELSLLDQTANLLSATYTRDIIDLIKRSTIMAHLNSRISNQLQTLINSVDEGIIALDENNSISVFNPVAEDLLGISCHDVIGRKTSCNNLPQYLQSILRYKDTTKETFLKVNNQHIIVNLAELSENNNAVGKLFILKNVTEIQRLEEELRRKIVSEKNYARYTFADLNGLSNKIEAAKNLAIKVASSDFPVLIQGESGTGKEIFAQSIHNASSRKSGPFIAINFAALSESLLESELFGYTEGSFTGAKKGGAPGLFEQGHKGTIFLDEIGDAPLSFQVRLLRVLQEKQIRRIGSSRIIPIDIRVITATNKDLKELIQKGEFRQDLYYRLKVLSLKLPPLRERRADIVPLLIGMYRRHFDNHPIHNAETYFSEVLPHLQEYDWPGNIRELQNVAEYLFCISPNEVPLPDLLPEDFNDINPICSCPNLTNEDDIIRKQLLAKIAEANNFNKSIGRRSLARVLGISEAKVRKLLGVMEQECLIRTRRGAKGLVLNADSLKS